MNLTHIPIPTYHLSTSFSRFYPEMAGGEMRASDVNLFPFSLTRVTTLFAITGLAHHRYPRLSERTCT